MSLFFNYQYHMIMSNPKPNSRSNLVSNLKFRKIDLVRSCDTFGKKLFCSVGIKLIAFFFLVSILIMAIFDFQL